MKRPKFISPCVADRYRNLHGTSPNSRIAEFANGESGAGDRYKGGLIECRNMPNGDLIVSLYSLEPGVKVRVNPDFLDLSPGDFKRLSERMGWRDPFAKLKGVKA